MNFTARPCTVADVSLWRGLYREEMRCQVVHDSLHERAGWTDQYLLHAGGSGVGYGSILVGGPWQGTRTVFEYYVLPAYRSHVFSLFITLLQVGAATAVQAQTSDASLLCMLHWSCRDIRSEKIVFGDALVTSLRIPGALFRTVRPDDVGTVFEHHREPVGDYILEIDDAVVATGGLAWHYNRPYGDIFMEVDARFRRHGYGSYLVQELKKACYEGGGVPCARCDTHDVASISTLQRAGMVPLAHILVGQVSDPQREA